MNAVTRQHYYIEVRGWWEPMTIVCRSDAERDAKLRELYDRWDNDDQWRVCNPRIIVRVDRFSTATPLGGRY